MREYIYFAFILLTLTPSLHTGCIGQENDREPHAIPTQDMTPLDMAITDMTPYIHDDMDGTDMQSPPADLGVHRQEDIGTPVDMPSTEEPKPHLETPSEVRFGLGMLNTTRHKTISLSNTGDKPFNINYISLINNDHNVFSISYPDPDSPDDLTQDTHEPPAFIEDNESISLRVRFTPQTGDPFTSTLRIESQDLDEGRREILLSGNKEDLCLKLYGSDDPPDTDTHQFSLGTQYLGRPLTRSLVVQNCSDAQSITGINITTINNAQGQFEVVNAEELAAINISPGQTFHVEVKYTPTLEQESLGEIQISASGERAENEIQVKLKGEGTNQECPISRAYASIQNTTTPNPPSTNLVTSVHSVIQLDGHDSEAKTGNIENYQWALISKPTNSITTLNTMNPTSTAGILVDQPGAYEVELHVTDSNNIPNCAPARVRIQASPTPSSSHIFIQLTWNTPMDSNQFDTTGADLDLHYLEEHPNSRWNNSPHDVYWGNTEGEWGNPSNTQDNPTLDIDDDDGFGPEQISHRTPAQGSYHVGVYYYDDNGFGSSDATVQIYSRGTLVYEHTQTLLAENIFWTVATISWPSGQILPKNTITEGFPSP